MIPGIAGKAREQQGQVEAEVKVEVRDKRIRRGLPAGFLRVCYRW